MSDRPLFNRRRALAALAFAAAGGRAHAQGFAGLGRDGAGFAPVTPGRALRFPDDFGAHPDFRIEWWYLTANLIDATGAALGLQWTLFRQALEAGPQQPGWANRQIWMGHAAITRADRHVSAETFARGGVGQAGVEASPFRAWIDAWEMRVDTTTGGDRLAPLEVTASTGDFSYALHLTAERPLVLQGDNGFSRKSERGQASYYFSQPYFDAQGAVTVGDRRVAVSGKAWMDREWSSQPLASDQTGWDWFSLHLASGDKVMLFRLRQSNGNHYFSGNWIGTEGRSTQLAPDAIALTPLSFTQIGDRRLPTGWRIAVPSREFAAETMPLNANAWMATSFPYWEGPIAVRGSQPGIGYLEMTGY